MYGAYTVFAVRRHEDLDGFVVIAVGALVRERSTRWKGVAPAGVLGTGVGEVENWTGVGRWRTGGRGGGGGELDRGGGGGERWTGVGEVEPPF